MAYQWALPDGQVVEGNYDSSIDSLKQEEAEKRLKSIFKQFHHNIDFREDPNEKEVYNVSVKYGNEQTKYTVCMKPMTPGGRSNLKDEQRIQQKADRWNYAIETKKKGAIPVLLGIYERNSEVIICAWKIKPSTSSSPLSKQIKISVIADAYEYGFSQQAFRNGNELVCAFRPEFLFFYLKNIIWIHDEFAKKMNKYDELKLVFDNEEEDEHQYNEEKYNSKLRDKFRQYIYFGAPGTGKSYQLNKDSKLFLPDKIERVTFHPNMTYGQFVGVFKPFPIEGDKITYRYVPGALMNQLVEALLHPESAFLLIVEELNRANVAAVFGDMFQLLDRKSDFSSEYPINISEDLNWYFENVIYKEPRNLKYVDNMKQSIKNGLIFPSNFYIWTTMNSADQGVMPMDTAFKRRWEQRYFGINDSYNMNEVEFSQYKKIIVKTLVGSDAPGLIAWNDIREFLNERLTLMKVPEDKLMGPYFISKSILESTNEQLTESFKTKVLMYLFDDAAKQRPNDIFALSQNKMMYSALIEAFNELGIGAFLNYESLQEKVEPYSE
ncbi:AAA family ATPase [Enterococcus faecium]|uniref:AAA family ATPase n=1 Tax=Enterococcus faecium TaxID=1352 RepID=UPI0027B5FECA|nr:AAA family ATPase [Enterococcus faecium]MDQ2048191.1 AAA family ATPase [Enterococcus faecium]